MTKGLLRSGLAASVFVCAFATVDVASAAPSAPLPQTARPAAAMTEKQYGPKQGLLTRFVNRVTGRSTAGTPPAAPETPRAVIAGPAVLSKHTDVQYGEKGKHLFHAGVKVTDVDQGQIGDCYFAAGMSSVAQRYPKEIQKAFTHNKDGSLTVRFYQKQGNGSFKPVDVTIDRQIPLRGDRFVYARGHNSRHVEQWPALMEKAFAQYKKDYGAIEGGWSSDVFEMLTGKPAQRIPINASSADTAFETIKNASRTGKPMAASSFNDDYFGAAMTDLEKQDPQNSAIVSMRKLQPTGELKYEGTGVHGNHAYSVLGVNERNGEKFVVLRNPWGYNEPAKEGFGNGPANQRGDGIFELPVKTFVSIYQRLDVGG